MVRRFVLVLAAAFLLSVSADDLTCSKYRCKNDDEDFVGNTCIFFDVENDVHILEACDDDYICTPVTGTNSTCFKEPTVSVPSKYPGEDCDDDEDCVYDLCVDDQCAGIEEGDVCTSTLECDPGLYCDTITLLCTELKDNDVPCLNDFECGMHSYCQLQADGKVCAAYFTVTNGVEIEKCDVIAAECETLYCYEDEDTSPKCFEAVKSKNDTPNACVLDIDCLSSYSTRLLYSECTCGFNENGDSYCGLFGGDSAYQKLINYYKAWLSGDDIKKCNSARRESNLCMKDMMDKEDYWDLTYYYLYVTQYSQTRNNDDCVKDIYNQGYYIAKDKYEEYSDDDSDDDSSYTLGLAAFAALLVML